MHRGPIPPYIYSTMPEIIWDGYCKICRAPLDPFFLCFNKKESDIFDTIDISTLSNNYSKYKFINGMRLYRVCTACMNNLRDHKKDIKIKRREIGHNYPIKHISMTQLHMKEWFFSLQKLFE